jgi:hypothetical protein
MCYPKVHVSALAFHSTTAAFNKLGKICSRKMPARASSLMILNRNVNRTRSLLMLHWDIKMLFNAGKCETKKIRGVSRCYYGNTQDAIKT